MTETHEHVQPSFWHRLLDRQLTRRGALGTAAATTMAAALPITFSGAQAQANNGGPVEVDPRKVNPRTVPPFRPVDTTNADTLTVPGGYRWQMLAPWGEVFTADGREIGFNHDYVGFFPADLLEGGRSSTDALLTINHEYANALFVGGNTKDRTREQIEAEMRAVGVSVVRVRKSGGEWKIVPDPRNRRLDAFTEMELTGPVRGSAAVKGATRVRGTVGNCSGGQTPWGTLLTCEENVDGYTKAWAGSGYEALHQGWVTEIDPFDPAWMPKKRTGMGRFRHENAAVTVAKDGRVVVYMGDDMQDACVYKFVSRGKVDPANRRANRELLEDGDLYVANFGNGTWALLDYARNKKLQEARGADGKPLFTSQVDVLLDARASALAVGGTPVDRPEDIEIHPRTGEVYVALTNNSKHGNYFGQIIRFREEGDDWAATDFLWEVFAVGGPQSGFASPDNLVFDPYGNLWMVTDNSDLGTNPIKAFHGNNAMFFFPTEGGNAGRAYRFAIGPVDAELTGPVWSPDGKTLFLSVQHPGEDSESLDTLTSTFGAKPGTRVPRPTLVAIEGFPGWREG
ncbi:PhoX family phosphatase [Deinococcus sp. MIMF12]|uniref:PhoX family phosphatase n=1 Tax=Deinococcus rhizophilus TaxID=3049544 RepID=A0ABT7JFL2_9DEIO|nr:PhoX family phosphatase [Deinococcus rhizophilus]MDL2343844.1 PhoX family phosphatase [Deinococcus rhizophilus]